MGQSSVDSSQQNIQKAVCLYNISSQAEKSTRLSGKTLKQLNVQEKGGQAEQHQGAGGREHQEEPTQTIWIKVFFHFRSQLTAEAHQRTQEENRRITASVVKRTIRALRVMSERTARTGYAGFARKPGLFG